MKSMTFVPNEVIDLRSIKNTIHILYSTHGPNGVIDLLVHMTLLTFVPYGVIDIRSTFQSQLFKVHQNSIRSVLTSLEECIEFMQRNTLKQQLETMKTALDTIHSEISRFHDMLALVMLLEPE